MGYACKQFSHESYARSLRTAGEYSSVHQCCCVAVLVLVLALVLVLGLSMLFVEVRRWGWWAEDENGLWVLRVAGLG